MTDPRLTFLGVLRDDGALSARLVRQAVAPEFGSREAAAQAAAAGAWWEIVECPLADLPAHLLPAKAPLLAAWEALGAVAGPTIEAQAALRLVLAETVLEALFAEHDRRLSSALGLPLYDAGGDGNYEIATSCRTPGGTTWPGTRP